MIYNRILKYVSNCFYLISAILLWNVLFASSLPRGYAMEFFWKDIPPIIGIMENMLRIIVFFLPLLMPLKIKSKDQKIGLSIYFVGLVIYFLSWIMQINYPDSSWSNSIWGFLAPAYTTIIWLIGIGLIGNKLYIKIPYNSIIYISISALFVIVHTTHAYIVYMRL